MKRVLPTLERRPSLGHETSAVSVQSDSTLEFHLAASPGDVMRPAKQDEDDEVIVRRPDSGTTAKLLPDEKNPIADQKMKSDDASESEMRPAASEERAKEHTEAQIEESTTGRDFQNVTAPITSLEESNRDDSVSHEVVLSPRESIRTSGMSEETIRKEQEIKDFDPAPSPVSKDAVSAEEPIRKSPEEAESCDSKSEAVSEELREKPEAMETSGKNS